MKIYTHALFDKYFKKRIESDSKLVSRYKKRLSLFVENLQDPLLKDHSLTGTLRSKRAFSVTGEIRVICIMLGENTVLLLDIGSHNQVY